MSAAALAADVPTPRRSRADAPPRSPLAAASRGSGSAPHLTALPAARSASPVHAPAPAVTPSRRPRIEGATTDRLPVRGCSGESLGRRAPEYAEPATLHLTRRGRVLLTAVSVLVFGAAIVVLGLRVAGVLEPGPHFTHTVPVQVAPGQTLWSIAHETNPGQDPGTVVEKIADVNNLSSPSDIVPGETLQVPVAG
jgi:nucleoid-associated protein YgaU